jgi:hypothetical protein
MINSTKSGSPWWYNGGLRGEIWMTYFEVVKRQHFFLCFGGKNCNDFDPLSMVSEVWFRWLRWSSPRSKCSSEAWSRRVDLCRWILGNGWNEWWLVGYSFFFWNLTHPSFGFDMVWPWRYGEPSNRRVNQLVLVSCFATKGMCTTQLFSCRVSLAMVKHHPSYGNLIGTCWYLVLSEWDF